MIAINAAFQDYIWLTISLGRALIFPLIFFTILIPTVQSQDCNCTVEQVQDNTVTPCSITIGTVETVSSVTAIRTAINNANNGGGNRTILIEDGTYEIASTTSFPYITASNVVFRSVSGNRDGVILTGGGMVPSSSTENGFLIAGNNVTIADLTIRDVGNHGIQVSGHNLYVHNVRIQNTYEQMIKGSTSATSIDDAIIQCSLFEYTAGVGPNWYIGGLDIHKGKNWMVKDNVFKDISSPSGSIAEHAIHFWDNSLDNTVERNLIFNCDRGIGFGLADNGNQNDGGIIRNNMIYNDGVGLFNDVGIGLESSPNSKVYNNTIFVEYQNAIEYRFATTTNADIINNLSNRPITSRNGGSANVQTNVTNATENWFADISIGDLHLASNEGSVVDQGTQLTDYVSDDMDQTNRPLGLGYDIGAHENQATRTKSISTQNNLMAFPNPCSSNTIIKVDRHFQNATLLVIDALGNEVKKVKYISKREIALDLDDVVGGIYFVLLRENFTTIETMKLVVL